jgi:ATP phosphoribosyltransferase
MKRMRKNELTIALPNKGRIQPPSLQLLEDIGIRARVNGGRELEVPTSKPGVRVLFARAQDIPLFVERGAADLGMTGKDCIAERGSRVEQLLDLDFGACKVALAAPRGVKVPKTIATALPNMAAAYCAGRGWDTRIVQLGGALESAPRLGIAEAIVDQVETGATLRENRLRVLDVIMESRMCLIGNAGSAEAKAGAIRDMVMLARGIMDARKRVLLKLNAAGAEARDRLARALPAMKSPDVTELACGGFSLLAAVPRKGLEELVVKLKGLGATDIVVSAIQMLVS